MYRRAIAVVSVLAIAPSVGLRAQQPDAKLTAQKAEAVKGVDEMAKLAQEMVDSVFSFGELGFQEVETSRYLTGAAGEVRLQGAARLSAAFRRRGWRRGDRASR